MRLYFSRNKQGKKAAVKGRGKNPKTSSELHRVVASHSFHPGARSRVLSAASSLLSEEVLSMLRGGSQETEFAKLL